MNENNISGSGGSGKSLDRLARVQWLVSKHKGLMAFEVEAGSKRPKNGHSWYLRQTNSPEQLAKWAKVWYTSTMVWSKSPCQICIYRGGQLVSQERPADCITVLEVSASYGVNPETVRRWVREGKLAARRLGNMLYIGIPDIEQLMQVRRGRNGE